MKGVFPYYRKCTVITPLFKKGGVNDLSNYRPISRLTGFSKLFEKIAYNRLCSFTMKFELIECHQDGFLKSRGTETAWFEFLVSAMAALERRDASCDIL